MSRRSSALVMTLALVVPAALPGQEPSAPSTLEAARAAYLARSEPGRAVIAVDLFTRAAREDKASYEARWEGARAVYFLGAYAKAEASDAEKTAIFDGGITLAREAIVLQPKGVEGHFWLGVLDGVYGEARGIFKSLALVPEIKKEMQLCLDADPAVEGWGPDRTLGRVYFKLPWFKGGDNKKSIAHLEKSLQGEPGNALTRLYLAETLRSEGEKARAVELLREVVAMTPDPRWAAEHPLIKAQAEKLLKKLQ
jgi:tetratricopeptide (TPR) repeat protein